MGRALPGSRRGMREMPKMVPLVWYSLRIQSMSWSKGMGCITSLIVIFLSWLAGADDVGVVPDG